MSIVKAVFGLILELCEKPQETLGLLWREVLEASGFPQPGHGSGY